MCQTQKRQKDKKRYIYASGKRIIINFMSVGEFYAVFPAQPREISFGGLSMVSTNQILLFVQMILPEHH